MIHNLWHIIVLVNDESDRALKTEQKIAILDEVKEITISKGRLKKEINL